jgi:23S rRNA pseudouridine2605 synthase
VTTERLQKFLSRAGVASRRHAETLIVDGRVKVNGKTVTVLGSQVDAQKDLVLLDGKLVSVNPERRYFLFYKPPGVVTTLSDPEGRPTVGNYAESTGGRVFPVGRLDYDAEGALLLTDDGDLANKLMHPSHQVPRVYLAKVKGTPDDASLQKLVDGVRLEDGMAHAVQARIFDRAQRNTWVKIVVTEGRQHLVKRLCAAIGHPVVRLYRPAHAGLSVHGLKPGELRALSNDEIRRVKAAADGDLQPEPSLYLPARRHGHAAPGFEPEEDEGDERPRARAEKARDESPRAEGKRRDDAPPAKREERPAKRPHRGPTGGEYAEDSHRRAEPPKEAGDADPLVEAAQRDEDEARGNRAGGEGGKRVGGARFGGEGGNRFGGEGGKRFGGEGGKRFGREDGARGGDAGGARAGGEGGKRFGRDEAPRGGGSGGARFGRDEAPRGGGSGGARFGGEGGKRFGRDEGARGAEAGGARAGGEGGKRFGRDEAPRGGGAGGPRFGSEGGKRFGRENAGDSQPSRDERPRRDFGDRKAFGGEGGRRGARVELPRTEGAFGRKRVDPDRPAPVPRPFPGEPGYGKPPREERGDDDRRGPRRFGDKPGGPKRFGDKPGGPRRFGDKPGGPKRFGDKPGGGGFKKSGGFKGKGGPGGGRNSPRKPRGSW